LVEYVFILIILMRLTFSNRSSFLKPASELFGSAGFTGVRSGNGTVDAVSGRGRGGSQEISLFYP
jgi:hypothetical protein